MFKTVGNNRWWVATLILLAALLALWGGWQFTRRSRAETALENSYQRAFYSVLGHTESLEVLLGKTLASSTGRQQTALLSNVWLRASAAGENLAQLPFIKLDLARSHQYLSQLSDYARVLAETSAQGENIKGEDWNKLAALHTSVGELSQRLHDLQDRLSRGGFRRLAPGEALRVPGLRDRDRSAPADGFQEIDEFLQQVPTMIYDGPFSDHVENRKPLGIRGEEIDASRAREIARNFLAGQVPTDNVVVNVREIGGPIPKFSVTFGPRGTTPSREIMVDVSKRGGKVLWFLDGRRPGSAAVGIREAVDRAGKFLKERGFANLTATGSLREGNTLVTAFVPVLEGTVIYPDQLKVRVALDNGRIIGFEAVDFYLSNHDRRLPEPRLSEGEARQLVNDRLQVLRVRKALIPLESLREVLTYEVRARLEEDQYLIYFNALTGDEEAIMQVIETPDGTLTY